MKHILIFVLFYIFLHQSLFAQQNRQQVIEVSITSFGELGDCKYSFTANEFIEKQTASGIEDSALQKIKSTYWKKIIGVINEIKIDSFNLFVAPTNLRAIDGDWYSYITIITKTQTLKTQHYDTSEPNKSLYKLDSILWAFGNYHSTINWDSLYSLREPEKIISVYHIVDERPHFPAGKDSLRSYIMTKLKERSITTGKAFVQCIVNKDGQLKEIELVKADNDLIGKAAINILKEMPNWIPGKVRGQAVDAYLVIPIGYGFKYP